jgi:hypothetical protein
MPKLNVLVHLTAMSESLKKLGLRADLQFDTFRLEVASGGHYHELLPEFLSDDTDGMKYRWTVNEEITMFGGWRPSPRKHWTIASDKLAFKQFCARNQLRTPKLFGDSDESDALVLLKEKAKQKPLQRGTIDGPIPLRELVRGELRSRQDRYAEEYIAGDSLEAWYWDGVLYCVERHEQPYVVGDGSNTLRGLAERSNVWGGVLLPMDWPVVEAFGRLQGLSLDSVVPRGTKVTVDFRFNSAFRGLPQGGQENVLDQLAGDVIHEQLVRAGQALWLGVPEHMRAQTAFSVRATVDAQRNVWLTDMDADRYLHPDIYPLMMSSLFGVADIVPPPPGVPGLFGVPQGTHG